MNNLIDRLTKLSQLEARVWSETNYDGDPSDDDLDKELDEIFGELNLLPYRWCELDPLTFDCITIQEGTQYFFVFVKRATPRRLTKEGFQIFELIPRSKINPLPSDAQKIEVPPEIGFAIATYEKDSSPRTSLILQSLESLKLLMSASSRSSNSGTLESDHFPSEHEESRNSQVTAALISKCRATSKTADEVVAQIAKEWAKKYSVNESELVAILRQCAVIHFPSGVPLERYVAMNDTTFARDVLFSPQIHGALELLGGRKAIQLFQSVPIETISAYETLFQSAGSLRTPFRPLEKWPDLISDCHRYQTENRQSLIDTGYVSKKRPMTLDAEGWMFWYLENLYPTEDFTEKAEENHDFQLDPSPLIQKLPFLSGIVQPRRNSSEDDWDSVRPTSEDLAQLENMRGDLFEIRTGILNAMWNAASSRSTGDLWGACMAHLTSKLNADQYTFLLKIDRWYYYESDYHTSPLGVLRWPHYSGGLTDLLYLVGVLEKEIEIGTCCRAYSAVHSLAAKRNMNRHANQIIASYYLAVKEWGATAVNRIYDLIIQCDKLEQVFWKEYSDRVYKKAIDSFSGSPYLLPGVKKQFENLLIPHVKTYAQLCEKTLELTGRLPQLLFETVTSPDLPANAIGIRSPQSGLNVVNPQATTSHSVANDDLMRLMEDDKSVLYKGQKYRLPADRFEVLLYLAKCMLKGNASLHKRAINVNLDREIEKLDTMSVRKWFLIAGGDSKRFAEAGLIESVPPIGCFKLSVSRDHIRIVAAEELDESSGDA